MLHEFNGYSTKSLPLHRIHYLALLNRMLPFFHKEQPTGILKWELKESYMYMYLQYFYKSEKHFSLFFQTRHKNLVNGTYQW